MSKRFIIFLIFSVFLSCSHTSNKTKYNTIAIKTIDSNIRVDFPLDYYVVSDTSDITDLGFCDEEIAIMQTAADDWSRLTNNIVKVNLHKNWIPPYPFDVKIYKSFPYKNVWKFDWNSAEAKLLFNEVFNEYTEFCGLSWGNIIIIIESDDKGCAILYSTFAHELGHQFGLDHVKPQYPAVMNPQTGIKGVGEYDVFLFCYLYNCLEESWFLNQKY